MPCIQSGCRRPPEHVVKARPSNQNREVRLFVRKRETNERAEERNWDHGKMGFCRVGELKSRQIWECTIRLFMKKSMDDIGLRKKIVKLLRDEGATSSEEELNRAVMNMLKMSRFSLSKQIGCVQGLQKKYLSICVDHYYPSKRYIRRAVR